MVVRDICPETINPKLHRSSEQAPSGKPQALRPSAHTDGGFVMGRYWVQAQQLVGNAPESGTPTKSPKPELQNLSPPPQPRNGTSVHKPCKPFP